MPRPRTVGPPRVVPLLPLFLAALLRGGAACAEETPPGPAMPPDPGTGQMFMKTEDSLVPLPALDMKVDLEVTGPLVQGTVRQTFRNPSFQVVDVVYLFPLPDGAAVDSLELQVGDRVIRSEVREREAARAQYDAARRE